MPGTDDSGTPIEVGGSLRVQVQVVAGVIPGEPMPEYTKTYHVSSGEWSNAGATALGQQTLLTEMTGRATAWATFLMLQPDRVNWVNTEWVWF